MLGVILHGAPSTVEVGGAPVHVRSGFRAGLLAETLDRGTAEGRTDLLRCLYAKGGELPREVSHRPAEALSAGLAWHDAAWGLVGYGEMPGGANRPGRPAPRRVFDWSEDAGIVAADFSRFYGIDLADPATQLHWYRFMALFLSLLRTPDSLVAAAVSARSPLRGGSKEARAEHSRLARAWALSPTDDELRKAAEARF